MIIDARQISSGEKLEAEICIIGAGAAGITVAKSLENLDARIILLESGGEEFENATFELTRALNVGRPYPQLPGSRLRYFGGTTNLWGGHCAPMRSVNFEPSPSIPYSGWPFVYADLEPYYRRAHDIIDLGPFRYGADYISGLLGKTLFPFDPTKVETVFSRYNAKRFGPAYRNELKSAANIDVLLHANVTLIDRDPVNRAVNRVSVATLDGKAFDVVASIFVLATGGIENARLLLHSRNVETTGLGNGYDLVGRFFMEHIWYQSGTLVPFDKGALYDVYGSEIELAKHEGSDLPYRTRAHLALPEDVVRREGIADFRAEIQVHDDFYGRSDSLYWARRAWAEIKKSSWPSDLRYEAAEAGKDPEGIVEWKLGVKQQGYYYLLNNFVEQTPNPNSRIRLADERDALGIPLPAVEWRLTELDKFGIRRAHELIAAEAGRSGFGRFRLELEDAPEFLLEGAGGGWHHMGTTRMHDNPRLGVVDRNAKVYGLENLYIAGSSVFPTCGYINPTMTITALALRLSDHLKERLARHHRAAQPVETQP